MNNLETRIKPIDSLRGIAALGIAFFWHYGHFGASHFPFQFGAWFRDNGWILVDFFFILSGFIFMYVYRDEIVEQTISFEKYMLNRISRLYPLHIATLIILCIAQGLYKHVNGNFFIHENNDVYHFILNLLCLHAGMFEKGGSFNWPSWSIAIEMIGYILFFHLLFKYGKSKKSYLIAFIAIIFIGLTIQKQGINFVLFNSYTSRLYISFFVGTLLFEFNNWISSKSYYKTVTYSIVCLLAIYILLTDKVGTSVIGNDNTFTLFVFPSIIYLSLNIGILNKVLSFKGFTFLGDISFSVYMLHFPVQILIKLIDTAYKLNINYSSKWFFLFYASSTIVLATLSYYLFEKRAIVYIRNNYKKA